MGRGRSLKGHEAAFVGFIPYQYFALDAADAAPGFELEVRILFKTLAHHLGIAFVMDGDREKRFTALPVLTDSAA